MDDRTKGLGDERTTGRGDDSAAGWSGEAAPRTRTSAPGAAERTRTRSDERGRASAGIAERHATGTDRETERLRDEIEQTRDDMSETIDAIQDRLRPGNVAANAAGSVRDAASNAASTVRDVASDTFEDVADSRFVREVRANPVPAVMVGVGIVGLAWLAFGGRERRRRTEAYDHGTSFGYYEQREDYYRGSARPRSAYASGGAMTGAAREAASRTGEYASEATARARQTTRRAQSQLQRAMRENPLAVGAAALAVGAIIGMALPETERENEWLGEARDNVVEGAQDMARTAATRVQDAATDAADRVKEVVSDPAALLNKKE